MRSQNASGTVDEFSRRKSPADHLSAGFGINRLRQVSSDRRRIIPVRRKTDVLAVMFSSIDKAVLLRDLPCFFLCDLSEREQHVRQLLLSQIVKNVALIFGRIGSLFKSIPAGLFILPDPRIMPCNDIVAAQFCRSLHERPEFQVFIAVDTGIRGSAAAVIRGKTADHLLGKLFLRVENVKGDPHSAGTGPGILHVIKGAAGALLFCSRHVVFKQPHGAANSFHASFPDQQGCDAAVYSSAHCYKSFFIITHLCGQILSVSSSLNVEVCSAIRSRPSA